MAVKIKSTGDKPRKNRKCNICGKSANMEMNERFCSPQCRSAATDIDKYGTEHKITVSKR